MNEEFKEALELIKKECNNHENCEGCPLYERKLNFSRCDEMFNELPYKWELD